MSKYKTIETQYKNANSLKRAIKKVTGIDVTLYADAGQKLVGYQGNARNETANLIIPRITVNRFSGGSSNDIGFLKKSDGTFEAVVSEYDKRNNGAKRLLREIKQEYTYQELQRLARARGYTLQRQGNQGEPIKVKLVMG